ncbi:hypothetical protein ACFQ51_50410 [Streptomyces kaempferi]
MRDVLSEWTRLLTSVFRDLGMTEARAGTEASLLVDASFGLLLAPLTDGDWDRQRGLPHPPRPPRTRLAGPLGRAEKSAGPLRLAAGTGRTRAVPWAAAPDPWSVRARWPRRQAGRPPPRKPVGHHPRLQWCSSGARRTLKILLPTSWQGFAKAEPSVLPSRCRRSEPVCHSPA